MIAAPRRGLLVVVSGPSGVGKGSVCRRLVDELPSAWRSVSVTTRPPRADETDGVDYHFVDDAGFDRMLAAGELLEWAPYAGARYATPRAPVEERLAGGVDVLLEIEVRGARQVDERVPEALLVFLAPPSDEELARRLAERGTEDDAQQRIRLATADRELAVTSFFDHVVVNDELERCVEEVRSLIDHARAVRASGPVDRGP